MEQRVSEYLNDGRCGGTDIDMNMYTDGIVGEKGRKTYRLINFDSGSESRV